MFLFACFSLSTPDPVLFFVFVFTLSATIALIFEYQQAALFCNPPPPVVSIVLPTPAVVGYGRVTVLVNLQNGWEEVRMQFDKLGAPSRWEKRTQDPLGA